MVGEKGLEFFGIPFLKDPRGWMVSGWMILGIRSVKNDGVVLQFLKIALNPQNPFIFNLFYRKRAKIENLKFRNFCLSSRLHYDALWGPWDPGHREQKLEQLTLDL